MKQPLLVVYAPTASGKTELALQLASRMPIEVISADSRQVYRRLDIGTAKPSREEQAILKHHLIDIRDLNASYSAGQFAHDAGTLVMDVYKRGSVPIVVGGSGLYISALCEGIFSETANGIDDEKKLRIRRELGVRLETEGRDRLYQELQMSDPISAQKYADKNPRRVVRALEYFYINGHPLSEAHTSQYRESLFDVQYYVLERTADELVARIELRTKTMMDQGLVAELEQILQDGFDPSLQSLNTVGYKEVLQMLEGEIDLDTCMSSITQNTRRYAKRQRTWGRHQLDSSKSVHDSYDNIIRMLEKSILGILNNIKGKA